MSEARREWRTQRFALDTPQGPDAISSTPSHEVEALRSPPEPLVGLEVLWRLRHGAFFLSPSNVTAPQGMAMSRREGSARRAVAANGPAVRRRSRPVRPLSDKERAWLKAQMEEEDSIRTRPTVPIPHEVPAAALSPAADPDPEDNENEAENAPPDPGL